MYKAALIGLGNIAWKFDQGLPSCEPQTHLAALSAHADIAVVAGSSPIEEDCAAFRKAHDIAVYKDPAEMLCATSPDIVSICSPTEHHAEQLALCLEQNIPMIWLEKPVASTYSDIAPLLALADDKKNTSTILVNYQRRYAPSYMALRAMIQNKQFGELCDCQISYSKGLEVNGSHMLDIALFLAGDWTDISAVTYGQPPNNFPSFTLHHTKGHTTRVTGIDLPYHCLDVVATFETARISIQHGGMSVRFEEKVEHELFSGFYRLKDASNNALTAGFAACYLNALDDLVTSHKNRRLPLSNLWSATESMRIINTVQTASGL